MTTMHFTSPATNDILNIKYLCFQIFGKTVSFIPERFQGNESRQQKLISNYKVNKEKYIHYKKLTQMFLW